jgi:hypothetical protein
VEGAIGRINWHHWPVPAPTPTTALIVWETPDASCTTVRVTILLPVADICYSVSSLLTVEAVDITPALQFTSMQPWVAPPRDGGYIPTAGTGGYVRGTCYVINHCIGYIWNLFWTSFAVCEKANIKMSTVGYKVKIIFVRSAREIILYPHFKNYGAAPVRS